MQVLHFGSDYLALNIIKEEDLLNPNKSKTIKWLEFIFNLPYNCTNANTFEDITWIDTDEVVDFEFFESKKGIAVQIMKDGVHIITITKIDENSSMSTVSPYLYRYDFYGQFFNLYRLDELDILPYLKTLIEDIEMDTISSSIGRIDICADIAGCLPRDIENNFNSILDLKITKIREDKKTGSETINFVKTKRKTIRVYNKLIEAEHKKKKWFLDYFKNDTVTRLEVELNSEYKKKFNIKISDILDKNRLFGFYLEALNTSKYKFGITDFIKSELEKMNFKICPPVITSIDKGDLLKSCKYVKRFYKQAEKIRDIYELNPIVILLNGNGYILDSEIKEAKEVILSK